ncbi:hypothetical protein ACWGR4_35990 [Embleya sp. NPDC055664]
MLGRESFEIRIDGNSLGSFDWNDPAPDDPTTHEHLHGLELLASDLDAVQRHCRTTFGMPEALTLGERIDLRVARLLLEGHYVIHPARNTRTFVLTNPEAPGLGDLLAGKARGAVSGTPTTAYGWGIVY